MLHGNQSGYAFLHLLIPSGVERAVRAVGKLVTYYRTPNDGETFVETYASESNRFIQSTGLVKVNSRFLYFEPVMVQSHNVRKFHGA